MLLGILLVLLVIVCVCMVVVILLQRSEGGALGMGGGGGNFLSTRGTGDLLTRTTQILGAIFFILCLTITFLTGRSQTSGSVVDRAAVGKIDPNLLKPQVPTAPAPATPAAPGGFQAPTPSLGGPIGAPKTPSPSTDPFSNLPPAR
jgi:preprotein translocase subunit SecG